MHELIFIIKLFWLTLFLNYNMYETNTIALFIGENINWRSQILNRSLDVSRVDWVSRKDCSGWYQLSSLLCFMTLEWQVTGGTDVIVWVCPRPGRWLADQWGHVPVSQCPILCLTFTLCGVRMMQKLRLVFVWRLISVEVSEYWLESKWGVFMRGVIFVHALPLLCL